MITVQDKYADESIVIEHSDTVYTYAANGTGFEDRSIVARIQSDAAVRALGVVSVAYAANTQHVEFLYARVRHPDGTVVESQTADAIEMPQPVTREAPFYSDLKEKQLPIRSLRTGDTLEWKARITTTKSEAPGEFWGQDTFVDDTVALAETIELRVPANLSVNVWSPTAKPVESVAEGMHVYHWTSSQPKPTSGKEAEIAADLKKKTVWTADQELDSEQGKLPAIAWTTFKSWEDVGAWYRSLATDRSTSGPEIKAKVAELIAGKSSDEDKVRALYAYVATQIHYIGVDFGIGRYQPHTATEILANQYGDCKDKHTLLAAMLSAAGIQSDAVLIGAGIRFNTAVPSPSAFNHLITHLTVAGQPVWLDSTAEIAPYRMLYAIIRDKQALVVPATAAIHLDRTPADPPFPSFQTLDAVGSLDKEGTSHSRLTVVVRGDTELVVRSAFHQASPGQYNQVVQQISYGIGYAGTTSNADVTRPDNTIDPFKMSYDYEREKAGDWANYRIIPQVAPPSVPRFADSDPLIHILDLGTPRVETSHSEMKIPEGWSAILPEAVHVKSIYATYDESYRFENGSVYAERRIEILKQKVPTADLKTYKKWADDTDLGNESYIQLTRTSASVPATATTTKTPGAASLHADGPPIVTPGSEETMNLIKKAWDLFQMRDFDGSAKILDQVKTINPEQLFLWNSYGAVAAMRGKTLEAINDFQKEIKLHPNSIHTYGPLVQLQMGRGLKSDATTTLRAWAAADLSDPTPTVKLIDLLLSLNDNAGALAAGNTALTHLSEDARKDESFQLALGHAEIVAGDKSKGVSILEALLNDSQNPGILNDAAYDLADASLDLPLAEKSSRSALNKLTEENASLNLDADIQKSKAQNQLIAATWDTLGWTLFREGKTVEGESYLRAAWIAHQSPETNKHLTAIASPLGHKPQLDDMRKFALGSSNGRNGDAEYNLLLKDGKIVDIKPVGDKTIAGTQALMAKIKFNEFFPAGSQITLVRSGYVNCHSGICELILEP